MAKSGKLQVNADFSNDPELLVSLDKMVVEDDTDRSKFVRNLVRREVERRAQLELPGFESQANGSRRQRRSTPTAA